MRTIYQLKAVLIIGLLTWCTTGCTAVHDSMRISEKDSQWNPIAALRTKREKTGKEMGEPITMAAIWKDTTYTEPGKPQKRGFGGRIFFYDAESNSVPAEGELVIYGFDGESGDSNRPDKKFIFKADKFQEHFSESALGGSYSVWIPWDDVGGFRKSVTLIPIFKTEDDRVIQTGQSINVLPGDEPASTVEATNSLPYRYLGSSAAVIGQDSEKKSQPKNGVTRASFEEGNDSASDGADYNQTKLRVSSISLTPNLRQMVEKASRQSTATPSQAIQMAANRIAAQTETQNRVASKMNLDGQENPEIGEDAAKVSSAVYGAPGPIQR
ncbi:MAG: hypothetical protein AAFN77_18675 [Planctomycetota bacterium]